MIGHLGPARDVVPGLPSVRFRGPLTESAVPVLRRDPGCACDCMPEV